MFTIEHPLHGMMAVPYMADVEYNMKSGWKLVVDVKVTEATIVTSVTQAELDEYRKAHDTPEAAYERKFGKKPHWKMKLDNIIKALE